MRFNTVFSMISLAVLALINTFIVAQSQVSTEKPVYLYFKEIAVITDKLATWKPSNNPNDLPGAAKDLNDLSGKLNETIQVFQSYNGIIDEQTATNIQGSLDEVLNDVYSLVENIIKSKEIFENFNTTSQIISILQNSNNQFSILFYLIEQNYPKKCLEKLEISSDHTICSINQAIKSLNQFACQPQGEYFCYNDKWGTRIPINPKKVCKDNELQGGEEYFVQVCPPVC